MNRKRQGLLIRGAIGIPLLIGSGFLFNQWSNDSYAESVACPSVLNDSQAAICATPQARTLRHELAVDSAIFATLGADGLTGVLVVGMSALDLLREPGGDDGNSSPDNGPRPTGPYRPLNG